MLCDEHPHGTLLVVVLSNHTEWYLRKKSILSDIMFVVCMLNVYKCTKINTRLIKVCPNSTGFCRILATITSTQYLLLCKVCVCPCPTFTVLAVQDFVGRCQQPSFYRQNASYRRGVGDRRVG